MWVVKDSDSTIYLLGTLHMVKPGTEWRTEKINAAFAASEEVWLETSDLNDPKAQALVLLHGFDYDRPLSEKLAPEMQKRLAEVAEGLALDPAELESMRPWMVATTISMMQMMRDGYDVMTGVDQVLEDDAKANGKRIVNFATPEQHIMILAGLPEDVEVEYLMEALVDAEMSRSASERISDAWVSGNVKGIDLEVQAMKQSGPALYDVIIVKRNIDWTRRLADRMQGAGISFVAVGTGHLVGPEGLPALLAARGFEVERY